MEHAKSYFRRTSALSHSLRPARRLAIPAEQCTLHCTTAKAATVRPEPPTGGSGARALAGAFRDCNGGQEESAQYNESCAALRLTRGPLAGADVRTRATARHRARRRADIAAVAGTSCRGQCQCCSVPGFGDVRLGDVRPSAVTPAPAAAGARDAAAADDARAPLPLTYIAPHCHICSLRRSVQTPAGLGAK